MCTFCNTTVLYDSNFDNVHREETNGRLKVLLMYKKIAPGDFGQRRGPEICCTCSQVDAVLLIHRFVVWLS